MSQNRLPSPGPASCLVRPYPSSQKGGTLISEGVTDLEEHARRLCDPEGYRPQRCPRCGHGVLHVHGYRDRSMRGDGEREVVRIVIHRCAEPGCRATWRILPELLARVLWRSWRTVERETLEEAPSPSRPAVPGRTVRRWRQRLQSSGRHVVQVLATAGSAVLSGIARAVGLDGTRRKLVETLGMSQGRPCGQRLSGAAALLHRLCPGVRLM